MQRLMFRGGILVLVGTGIVYAIATIAGMFPFGGGGPGEGEAEPPAQTTDSATPQAPDQKTSAQPPQPLTKPLIVTIDSRHYLVDGQPKEVIEIVELAGTVPEQYRVKVVIRRRDTSRADAEHELEEALKANRLVYEMKDE